MILQNQSNVLIWLSILKSFVLLNIFVETVMYFFIIFKDHNVSTIVYVNEIFIK